MMNNCRNGRRDAVGMQRVSNYDDIKKISMQAGLRALQRCRSEKNIKKNLLVEPKIQERRTTSPLGTDGRIKEMLKKHGSDDVINQQHITRPVFWSRHKL